LENDTRNQTTTNVSNPYMKSRLLCFYGLAVIACGAYRYFFAPGGEKGLWFGLVMGSIALLGSLLLAKDKKAAGLLTGFLSITFVEGWFCWECFVIKGLDQAEPRQLLMIVVSTITGLLLAFSRKTSPSHQQKPG
jgi:hypothetical protein